MHSPWFLKLGLVKVCQPPFLHWSLLVGPGGGGVKRTMPAGPVPAGKVEVSVFVTVSIAATELIEGSVA